MNPNRPRVLLVDDDVDTREMYGWSLDVRGFDVLTAGNASRALELALAHAPAVIVTDFTLPGGDGFVLAKRVQESPALRDTPLMLVSGRAFIGSSAELSMRLFDRVLVKPVLPDDLIAEIVPLVLNRAAAVLERQVRQVREHVRLAPTGSHAASRLVAALADVSGASTPAALVADSSARFIEMNDAACALTGRSREELLSLHVWDLQAEPGAGARKDWEQFVTLGSMAGAYELLGPAGTRVRALFSASAHVLPECHLSLLQPVPPALDLTV